jgi:D-alanine--poly(phosphoribitol) ligase subunit 2
MMHRIRDIVSSMNFLPGPIENLSDQDDLYDAGLTSFGSVQLMLAIEDAFDVEFPERMLTRKTFSSLAALSDAVEQLTSVKV